MTRGTSRPALTFSGQKAFAWAEASWRHCPHIKCRRKKRCTGGPRGTMRKSGMPFCRLKDVAEAIRARAKRLETERRERAAFPDWAKPKESQSRSNPSKDARARQGRAP